MSCKINCRTREPQIQLTQEQVGHVDEVLVGAVTPGFGLGGLDEAVEAFENAVADVAIKPAEDAIPMVHDSVGHLDHRR